MLPQLIIAPSGSRQGQNYNQVYIILTSPEITHVIENKQAHAVVFN